MSYLQMKGNIALCGVGIAVLAGCGGSQPGGPSNSGQSQTVSVGQAAATFTGKPKPLVNASSYTVSVSGLAGASFSAVIVSPAPNYANTFFAYSRVVDGVSEIYTVPFSGAGEQLLTFTTEGTSEPALSKSGYIFYNQLIGLYPYLMRVDGSRNGVPGISGPAYYLNPSISTNSTYVAFDGGGEELWYAPLAGGTAKLVQSNDNALGTSFEPNNATIAYVSSNGSFNNIFTTPIAGGTATNVTPYNFQTTGNWSQPSCSSDGLSIAGVYTKTGSSTSQVIIGQTNTSSTITITPTGFSDSCPSFSPDGQEIAFYRSTAGGAAPGIYVADYSGAGQHIVFPDPSGEGAVTSLCWSPFPQSEQLLGGVSHLYNENVDGFLLSQNGSTFGGICGFATTTAADAKIPAASTNPGDPLVFTLSGDNITMIEYTNSIYDLYNETLIQNSTITPAALVTIDSGNSNT